MITPEQWDIIGKQANQIYSQLELEIIQEIAERIANVGYANTVVLNDIPPDSTAVGVPARVVKREGMRVDDLDQVHIPDPVAQEIARLENEINELKKQIDSEGK